MSTRPVKFTKYCVTRLISKLESNLYFGCIFPNFDTAKWLCHSECLISYTHVLVLALVFIVQGYPIQSPLFYHRACFEYNDCAYTPKHHIIAQVYRLSAVHCQMTRYSQRVPGYLTRYSVSANEISFDKKISQRDCVFQIRLGLQENDSPLHLVTSSGFLEA